MQSTRVSGKVPDGSAGMKPGGIAIFKAIASIARTRRAWRQTPEDGRSARITALQLPQPPSFVSAVQFQRGQAFAEILKTLVNLNRSPPRRPRISGLIQAAQGLDDHFHG